MNRIVSLAFVFSVVLGVGAAIAADAKQAPRNVAVVSLFDDTFHKLQFGLMVFSGEFLEKDVPDWHVAETSETEMVALLKQKGIGENVAVLPQPNGRAKAADQIEQPLIQMAREAGFDTLVLIRPKRDEGNFREYVPGYGIGAWGKLFGPRPACPYAMFQVQVYRTADGERLDWASGFSSWDGPCVDLKSVPWQDKFEDYSEADWATLQAAIHKRIREGMARAIDNIDFR